MSVERLREPCNRLVEAALASNTAWERLGVLCDSIGARLSGSASLARAFDWAEAELRRDGFSPVRQRVMVPHWVRGKESATLLAPTRRALTLLGLGMSVGGTVTAPVLSVADFDELKARAAEAKGKIVLFDVPFTTYGQTVRYRASGPSEAARLGAVGCLIRAVGPEGFQTPHTGITRYAEGVPKIPAASLSHEDARFLTRLCARGQTPTVRLQLGARQLEDAPSCNLLADLPGRAAPEEIVLLGGHLDSWDVGQGAHDDGGGCLVCWEAIRLMKSLGLTPRRTVRLVLFTNEENGVAGGQAYAREFGNEDHVLALEADSGVGNPEGIGLSTKTPGSRERARRWEPLGVIKVSEGGGGVDIGPLGALGVPTAGLKNDMSLYWHIHHTHADTFDKVDPNSLARCVATVAAFIYCAAETDERI